MFGIVLASYVLLVDAARLSGDVMPTCGSRAFRTVLFGNGSEALANYFGEQTHKQPLSRTP